MDTPLIIKTFPLQKFYKRKADDKKQVIIRVRLFNQFSGKLSSSKMNFSLKVNHIEERS